MTDAAATAYVSEHFNFDTDTIRLGTCTCDGPENIVYGVLKDHKIQIHCPALEARRIARKHTWPEVALAEPLQGLGGGKKKPTKSLVTAYITTYYSARQLMAYTPPGGSELVHIPMPTADTQDNTTSALTDAVDNLSLVSTAADGTAETITPTHQVYVLQPQAGQRQIPFFNATHFTGEMLRAGTMDAAVILLALRSRDRTRITNSIAHAATRFMPERFRNTLTGNVLDFAGRFLLDTLVPPPVPAPLVTDSKQRPDRNTTWTPPSRDSVAAKVLFQKRVKEAID